MLLEKKKILFIHVPKTGGTTIGNIIHPNDKPLIVSTDNLGCKYSDIKKGQLFHFGEHEPFSYYEKYLNQKGKNISDFFIFAFVRNPYSRLYSTWKFIRQQVKTGNPIFVKPYAYDIKNSFQEWINILPSIKPYSWCQKQSFFIKRHQCNFLGRYENFAIDIQKVLSIIKVECKNVPILNRTCGNDEYKYHYNKRCKDIVYALFKNDFIEFNYER